jgi:drug/metabolite transporter (DMT)-like permease
MNNKEKPSTKRQRVISYILLVIGAFIWGSAFIFQKKGMDYIEPLAFNGIRNIMGATALLPFILIADKRKDKEVLKKEKQSGKTLFKAGIICGICLAAASTVQQYALVYTSTGKVGFITTLYIIFVPMVGVFIGKRFRPALWISVVLAMVGFYVLCLKRGEGFNLQSGDWMALACAFLFAFQILSLDKYTPLVSPLKLACVQFYVCGIICCILMFIFEKPTVSAILEAYIPLLYAGLLSTGVAYTFQALAQKNTNPVIASLIMSLESVFCVLTSWALLGEVMTRREMLGCVIIFVGIIIAQLPDFKKKKETEIKEEPIA